MTQVTVRIAALQGASSEILKERFRAALKEKLALSAWGSGVSYGRAFFKYETTWDQYPVHWTLSFSEGVQNAEVEVAAPYEIDEAMLAAFANKFVLEVLDATLSGTTRSYAVRRQFTYFGPPLDGEYWIAGYRIAPQDVSTELRKHAWVAQILIIDQAVDAIDEEHAWALASDRANLIAARLSLILDIGLHLPPEEWVWTSANQKGGDSGWRYRTVPTEPKFLEKMPRKGRECQAGAWVGKLQNGLDGGRKLSFPPETRRILRFFESASDQVRNAFDGCCRLYQMSKVLPREFLSARLALKVAAAESIAKVTEKNGSFSEFVRARSPLIKARPEFLGTLYGELRSGLFHSGRFYLRDLIRPESFADFDAARLRNEESLGETVLRHAIITWVSSNLDSHPV